MLQSMQRPERFAQYPRNTSLWLPTQGWLKLSGKHVSFWIEMSWRSPHCPLIAQGDLLIEGYFLDILFDT